MAPAHDESARPEEVLLRGRAGQAVDRICVHVRVLRSHVRRFYCNVHSNNYVL
jgi:hypothetical protein